MSELVSASEFYLSKHHLVTHYQNIPALHILSQDTIDKLENISYDRIVDLRRTRGVTLQILSHLPIDASPLTCRDLNNSLIRSLSHSDSFMALALLSTRDPEEAAVELRRCIMKYNFVGGTVVLGAENDGYHNKPWDERMDDVWRVAEAFNKPIALKMRFPTTKQIAQYEPLFTKNSPFLNLALTHVQSEYGASPFSLLAFYTAGIFDRFPRLKIFIASNGFSIPGLLPKIEALLEKSQSRPPT